MAVSLKINGQTVLVDRPLVLRLRNGFESPMLMKQESISTSTAIQWTLLRLQRMSSFRTFCCFNRSPQYVAVEVLIKPFDTCHLLTNGVKNSVESGVIKPLGGEQQACEISARYCPSLQ